ncbi:uncharacterized protein LOC109598681 [Aethina tumida]|uniref:uncharacterized protein LOC109598681 n=1 Tax=Aethina tumida TaxID=116153 RepID=UPI002147B1B6|nr:uncharacterized protein LOC109598681 [Aethina tumida]
MEGHLQGMLDRDQRTAKLRFRERRDDKVAAVTEGNRSREFASHDAHRNTPVSHCAFPRRASPYASQFAARKKGHIWNSIQRLKYILTYVTICTFPVVWSAPMDRMPGWWENPCGQAAKLDNSQRANGPTVSDSDLLQQILTQANHAYDKSKRFKEDYLLKTFKDKNWDEYVKEEQYAWLPSLPKKFGEDVPQDHLNTLTFDDELLKTYGYLQTIAVGLEQVIKDRKKTQGEFLKEFTDAESELKNVLCELQTTIYERKLTIESNVQRDVMNDSFKDGDITFFKTRDWVIYREYLNCLEYIIQGFNYLKSNL